MAESQPTPFKFSFRELLTLPGRLCNPPPAVGKVRSFGVVPIFEVKLHDVLQRKHLPPLGLKDFEEWLLFVEQCPENLYFVLWLQDYAQRYQAWDRQCKATPSDPSTGVKHRPMNPQLALFYSRAKQTFFTPNSVFELNVASDILAPFYAPDRVPHPDPAVFAQVQEQVEAMLEESLRNFVLASYTNVGTRRATCGIVAGTLFFLLGCIAPITKSFAGGGSRWGRLAALPGMWLGLTVLFASLHGLCLSIYFFGDVRQLRKFELLRPQISAPVYKKGVRLPIAHPPQILPPINTSFSASSSPVRGEPANGSPLQMKASPASAISGSNPQLTDVELDNGDDIASIASSTSSSSSSYPRCATSASIHISPQYYDEQEIEGPALCPVLPQNESDRGERSRNELYSSNDVDTYVFPPPPGKAKNVRHEFRTTARFIDAHRYAVDAGVFTDDDEDELDSRAVSDEEQGRMRVVGHHHLPCEPFDFEALPPSTDVSLTKPMRLAEVRVSPHTHTLAQAPTSAASPSSPRLEGPAAKYRSFLNMRSPTPLVAVRRVVSIPEHKTSLLIGSPMSLLRWIQAKCTVRWRAAVHPHHASRSPTISHPIVSPAHMHHHTHAYGYHGEKSLRRASDPRAMGMGTNGDAFSAGHEDADFIDLEKEEIKQHTRRRFRLARAVPAFASPLTRVLNPTVKRAQWEITVRSAIYAMIVSWVLLGGLVAAPET